MAPDGAVDLPSNLLQACEHLRLAVTDQEAFESRTYHAAGLLASSLTDASLRTSVGKRVVGPTSVLLKSATDAFPARFGTQTQLLRLVGNLVHSHDENRQSFLDHAIAAPLVCAVKSLTAAVLVAERPSHEEVVTALDLRAGVGAVLNLCLGHPPSHAALIDAGIFEVLITILDGGGTIPQGLYEPGPWVTHPDLANEDEEVETKATVVVWTLRILEELTANDGERKSFPPSAISILASLVLSTQPPSSFEHPPIFSPAVATLDIEIVSVAAGLLDLLTADDGPVQLALCQADPHLGSSRQSDRESTLLVDLLGFLQNGEMPFCWHDAGLDAEDEDEDAADQEKSDDVALEKTWSLVKACVGRSVTFAVSCDASLDFLWPLPSPSPQGNLILGMLTGWLKGDAVVKKRGDLVVVASIALGNLARGDDRALALVDHFGVVGPLADALKWWAAPERRKEDGGGEQAQALHGICSLLRNLALPASNKVVLGDNDVVRLSAECLRNEFDVVKPLLTTTVILLKHLCLSNQPNSLRLTTSSSDGAAPPVQRVLDVVARSDEPAIRIEGARLFANAIRSLSLHQPHPGDVDSELDPLCSKEVVESLLRLLQTPEATAGPGARVLLINEALVSLALLARSQSGADLIYHAVVTTSNAQTPPSEPAPFDIIKGIIRERPTSSASSALASVGPTSSSAPSTGFAVPPEVSENARTLIRTVDARVARSGSTLDEESKQKWAQLLESTSLQ